MDSDRKNAMRRSILYICLAAASVFAACEKNSDTTVPLGVDTRDVTLTKAGGSTKIMIWSTGQWNLRFENPVEWASLDRLKGAGNNTVTLSYSPNYDVIRQVKVIVESGAQADTVSFTQDGNAAVSMSFVRSQEIESAAAAVVFPLRTNLENHLDEITVDVEYRKFLFSDEDDEDVPEPESGWISDVKLSRDETGCVLSATVAANAGSRPRKAAFNLSYTDVKGSVHKTSTELVQMNP